MITKINKKSKKCVISRESFINFAQSMQDIFGPQLETIAQSTQFIQRKRKFTAEQWFQNALLAYAQNPDATLENLSEQFLESFNISISEQAISQRFQQRKTQRFHLQTLEMVIQDFIQITPKIGKIAEAFQGIYVGDCTTLALPDTLHDTFPGCGNQINSEMASMKIFCRYELFTGNYHDLIFNSGKTSDQKLYQIAKPIPAGSLELLDLGFYSTKRFEYLSRSGIYWISRVPAGAILTRENQEYSLVEFLKTFKKKRIDVSVQLGADKVSCRLVAFRAPPKVMSQRIERMKADAKRRGKEVSAERLFLAGWTVYATNVPKAMVSAKGIYDLYGLRWQVSLPKFVTLLLFEFVFLYTIGLGLFSPFRTLTR